MGSYLETVADMVSMMLHPHRTFKEVMRKTFSWRPLMIDLILLFLCAGGNVCLLYIRANHIIQDGSVAEFGEQVSIVKQIASVDIGSYLISLFTAPLISILFIAIVLYIISSLMHTETSFRQSVILVSYSWFPMIVAGVLTTLCILFFPIEITLTESNLFDMVLPDGILAEILSKIDLFYIWTLYVIATGACYLYRRGRMRWYVIVFVLLELPAVVSVIEMLNTSL